MDLNLTMLRDVTFNAVIGIQFVAMPQPLVHHVGPHQAVLLLLHHLAHPALHPALHQALHLVPRLTQTTEVFLPRRVWPKVQTHLGTQQLLMLGKLKLICQLAPSKPGHHKLTMLHHPSHQAPLLNR